MLPPSPGHFVGTGYRRRRLVRVSLSARGGFLMTNDSTPSRQPMKHVGILAHSAEGATLCYRTMWMEGVRRLGPHQHPEITLTGVAMAEALPAWERGDLAALRAFFMRDMPKLAAAGADFFVCPDNTAHIALEAPGAPFPIPCLHIGE